MRVVRVCAGAAIVLAAVLAACNQLNVTAMPFYESGAFFALAGAVLYWALRCPGWWGSALSLSLIGALFGLRLTAMWRMDKVNPHLVGGLLPYSDASQYYTEALRLSEFGYFSWASVNAGRPLWPGTIATVLSVTGGDLQIALALLTGIAAGACYCFARETRLSFGTATATLVLLALYLFYSQFIGLTSSEVLGLALGAVAAAVLLRAVRRSRRALFWSGLFLLCLAMQARPGAFFILPALVLWGTWAFGVERRFRAVFMAGCCAAVALGFVVQSLFMTFLVDPAAPPAFTKIGLQAWSMAVGRSPDDIYLVHPEGRGLPPQQLNPMILSWARAAIWANPLNILRDAIRVTLSYFYVYGGLVDYIHATLPVLAAIAKLNILGWVGLAVRYRDSRYGLVGAGIAGIVASVPMIAYVGSRANAAALPLMLIPPALAVSWIIASLNPFHWIKLTAALRRRHRVQREQSPFAWAKWRRVALPLGMALLHLVVLAVCVRGWAAEQPLLYAVVFYAPLVIVGVMGLVIMMDGHEADRPAPQATWATIVRSKARWHRWVHPPKEVGESRSALIYGLTLASVVTIGPFGIKSTHPALSLQDYRCPGDEVSAYLRVNPGSVVNVVEDGRRSQTRAPYVRKSDYTKPWGGSGDRLPPSFERELLNIAADHTIVQGIDLRTKGATGILWLNVRTTLLPRDPGIVRFCVPPSRYGMFTPSSAELVSQSP